MKTFKPKGVKGINNLIILFNFFHDACMRKICFLKNREVDEKNGSLIYPFNNIKEFINCDIEIELIHNNYKDAKKDQIILLKFKETKSFTFVQDENFDYSDIFEIEFKSDENAGLHFIFYSTGKKFKFLSIQCKKFICVAK